MRPASRVPLWPTRREWKEPIKAISIAFPQCPHNFNGTTYPPETRKDVFGRKVMIRLVETRHRIFRKYQVVSKLISAASGRLDAEIRRYSSDYDRLDMPAPQLQIQLGAIKGAPMPFQNKDVILSRLHGRLGPGKRER